MSSHFGSTVTTVQGLLPNGLGLEALLMSALVAAVLGLIAWSKYNEPPLSDPYATGRPEGELPVSPPRGELGRPVAVPMAATRPARKQP